MELKENKKNLNDKELKRDIRLAVFSQIDPLDKVQLIRTLICESCSKENSDYTDCKNARPNGLTLDYFLK
nr:hypothetical protein [Methanobrevibacter arboriphilus]